MEYEAEDEVEMIFNQMQTGVRDGSSSDYSLLLILGLGLDLDFESELNRSTSSVYLAG